jgi:hypothetical protein
MKSKKIWKDILQLILIILGVFLGIVAGNMNEHSKSKRLTHTTIDNLIKEIEGNNIRLCEEIAYHKILGEITDSLMSNLRKENRTKSFISTGGFSSIHGYKGPGLAKLESSVFETAKFSNVFSNIPLELLEKIFRTYTFQNEYNEWSGRIMGRLMDINWDTKTIDAYITLEMIKGEFSYKEKKLMEEYTSTLELLKKY